MNGDGLLFCPCGVPDSVILNLDDLLGLVEFQNSIEVCGYFVFLYHISSFIPGIFQVVSGASSFRSHV